MLLGLGFAFKLYPGAFVAPLMLYVLTASRPGRRDWWGAIGVGLAATATVVLVNLPFALAGYDGWRASFTFQELRKVDLTTNSIWFWGFRPDSEPTNEAFQRWVSWLSPTLVIASFVVALAVGWWRWRRSGSYPWIAVSAAMLCGFLLLHKVHSPQYTLWLVPFFVLLAVPWRWVLAYMVVDICMDVGVFRWFYAMKLHGNDIGGNVSAGLAAQLVALGVWGRAALLAVLFVVVLVGRDRLAAQGTPAGARALCPRRLSRETPRWPDSCRRGLRRAGALGHRRLVAAAGGAAHRSQPVGRHALRLAPHLDPARPRSGGQPPLATRSARPRGHQPHVEQRHGAARTAVRAGHGGVGRPGDGHGAHRLGLAGSAGRRPGARGNTAAARRVADDVRRWRACAAVLGPVVHADALRAQVTALVGQKPEVVNGVLLWRHL